MPFLDLSETLKRGIRATDSYDGQPSIASLKGLACRAEGLLPIEYPINPIQTTLGANLLPEGNFDSTGDWTWDAGWQIVTRAYHAGNTAGTLSHPIDIPAGTYRITGAVQISTPSAGTYVTITLGSFTSEHLTTQQNFSFDVTITGATQIDIYAPAGSNTIYLDDIQVFQTFSYDFPFPNLFVGRFGALLGFRAQLARIEAGWIPVPLEIYDADTPANGFQIQEGGVWDIAEFGQNWIATNGVSTVWRHGFLAFPLVLGRNNRTVSSVCFHRGRVLFGGWSDDPLDENVYYNQEANLYAALDKRAICWTAFGGADAFEYLMSGTLDTTQKDRLLRLNEGGFTLLPIERGVLRLLPMDDFVIVYTEDGIFRMPFTVDPPMYGVQRLTEACLYRRESVAGDEMQQVFLDTTGRLFRVTDEGAQLLGYQSVFLPFVLGGETVCITYDHVRNDFYITAADRYFLLTPQGLTETNRGVLTVRRHYDGLLGILGPMDSLEGAIVSDPIDLGVPDMKTLHSVRIASSGASVQPSVTLSGRMDPAGTWRDRTKELDATGLAINPVTGREIKFAVNSTNVENWKVTSLSMVWMKEGRTRLRA